MLLGDKDVHNLKLIYHLKLLLGPWILIIEISRNSDQKSNSFNGIVSGYQEANAHDIFIYVQNQAKPTIYALQL